MYISKNKRQDERYSVFWIIYEDYEHKNLLGYVNNISQSGVSFIICKEQEPKEKFNIKLYPHEEKESIRLPLDTRLIWFNNSNNIYNRWGCQFRSVSQEQEKTIEILIRDQHEKSDISRSILIDFYESKLQKSANSLANYDDNCTDIRVGIID